MIKAVIFDFDGTLTPLTLNFDFLRSEILKIAKKYAGEEAIKQTEGYYIVEMIYEIDRILDGSRPSFKEEAFEKLKLLELEASKNKDVYPYTRKVLTGLKRRGIKTGIITRTCLDVIDMVFHDFRTYTDGIVTREGTRHLKPDPLHVHEMMSLIGVAPKETMMVGDHPTDITAGRSAGTLTAGVLTGRTTKDAFEKAGATYILNDIREIVSFQGIIR